MFLEEQRKLGTRGHLYLELGDHVCEGRAARGGKQVKLGGGDELTASDRAVRGRKKDEATEVQRGLDCERGPLASCLRGRSSCLLSLACEGGPLVSCLLPVREVLLSLVSCL